jgi:hypothetical protein
MEVDGESDISQPMPCVEEIGFSMPSTIGQPLSGQSRNAWLQLGLAEEQLVAWKIDRVEARIDARVTAWINATAKKTEPKKLRKRTVEFILAMKELGIRQLSDLADLDIRAAAFDNANTAKYGRDKGFKASPVNMRIRNSN